MLLCSLILADLLSRNNFIFPFSIRCAKPLLSMGSSKRPSHSSTDRLLVITKLEARCRLRISSDKSADCWAVKPVQSQVVQDQQLRSEEGPEGTFQGVVDLGLSHGLEVVVGVDEADGVADPDG